MSKDKSFQYSPEGQKAKNKQKWEKKRNDKKKSNYKKSKGVQTIWR